MTTGGLATMAASRACSLPTTSSLTRLLEREVSQRPGEKAMGGNCCVIAAVHRVCLM